mgnify:CR=1 FL=1
MSADAVPDAGLGAGRGAVRGAAKGYWGRVDAPLLSPHGHGHGLGLGHGSLAHGHLASMSSNSSSTDALVLPPISRISASSLTNNNNNNNSSSTGSLGAVANAGVTAGAGIGAVNTGAGAAVGAVGAGAGLPVMIAPAPGSVALLQPFTVGLIGCGRVGALVAKVRLRINNAFLTRDCSMIMLRLKHATHILYFSHAFPCLFFANPDVLQSLLERDVVVPSRLSVATRRPTTAACQALAALSVPVTTDVAAVVASSALVLVATQPHQLPPVAAAAAAAAGRALATARAAAALAAATGAGECAPGSVTAGLDPNCRANLVSDEGPVAAPSAAAEARAAALGDPDDTAAIVAEVAETEVAAAGKGGRTGGDASNADARYVSSLSLITKRYLNTLLMYLVLCLNIIYLKPIHVEILTYTVLHVIFNALSISTQRRPPRGAAPRLAGRGPAGRVARVAARARAARDDILRICAVRHCHAHRCAVHLITRGLEQRQRRQLQYRWWLESRQFDQ